MAKAKEHSTRYIAFLRGINVGGHRVKMDVLRGLFAALGFAEVDDIHRERQRHLRGDSGPTPPPSKRGSRPIWSGRWGTGSIRSSARRTSSLPSPRFARSSRTNSTAGPHLHVAFLRDALDEDAERNCCRSAPTMDDFRVIGREFYWLCRGKTTDSLVKWQNVAKKIAMPSTMRNVKTIRQLSPAVSTE